MNALSDPLIRKYILTGFAIGILSGLLGVGGGIFLVPILVGYFGLVQHKAQAVSLAVVLPTALVGASMYGFNGQIDFVLAAELAVGGIIGAAIGACLMPKIPAATLKRMFGVLLCLAGARMLLS